MSCCFLLLPWLYVLWGPLEFRRCVPVGEEEGEKEDADVLLGVCLWSLFLFIYLFLERREGREKERKRNIDVREKYQSLASHMHPNWGPNL